MKFGYMPSENIIVRILKKIISVYFRRWRMTASTVYALRQ